MSTMDVSLPDKADKSPLEPKPRLTMWGSGKWLGLLSVFLYFAAWFAVTAQGFNLVRPIKFPSPIMVVQAAVRTADLIPLDALATVSRVLFGFIVGTLLGLGLGLAMSYNRKVYYFFDPLVESIRPVPVIAMIPFFLMWFGIGEAGKLLLITLGVFAIIVVSTVEAIKNVPKIYVLAAQTLGASKLQLFRTVLVPAIVPQLIGPMRVAAALSFTLVVAAEFMGANAGLGFRILEARRLFSTDVIMLGVVLIGILSAVADALIRRGAAYLTRWSERT
jgi:ABC-type nitrate/sulfonate/bicarbonate transport system permease component